MIVVTELTRTCEACPAQWEGRTNDNREVYVRYRWGYLSVRLSEPNATEQFAAVRGEEVFGSQLGDNLDGVLSFADLKSATAGSIAWPA